MKLRVSSSLLVTSCSGLLFFLAAAFCCTRWAKLIEIRKEMPFWTQRTEIEGLLDLPIHDASPSFATIPPLLQPPQKKRAPLRLARKGNLLVLEQTSVDNLEELIDIWENLPAPLNELHLEERQEGGYSLQLKLVSP